MEPVTIVSLISACMGVAKGAVDAIQAVDRARQIYGNAKAIIEAIQAKLGTLNFALTMLKLWAEQLANPSRVFPGLLEQLSVQIRGCSRMISVIRTKIETKDGLGHKSRGRFVWDESRIRDMERDLDSQAQALQFLFLICQFTDVNRQQERMQSTETQSILSTARKTASAYDDDLDTLATELAQKEFDFDDVVINSSAYRAVFFKHVKRTSHVGESRFTTASNGSSGTAQLGASSEVSSDTPRNSVGSPEVAQSSSEDVRASFNQASEEAARQSPVTQPKTHMMARPGESAEEQIVMLSEKHNLAEGFFVEGQWPKAESMFREIVEARTKLLGGEHLDTLASLNYLALTVWWENSFDEAEGIFTHVIESRTRILGEEDRETLDSQLDLAALYLDTNRIRKSQKLFEQVIKAQMRVLGESDRDTMWSMYQLAEVHYKRKKYKKAEALYKRVIELGRKSLGEEHRDTLSFQHELGRLYLKTKRYQEARNVFERVVEARVRVSGEDHVDTVTSMIYLGIVCWELGQKKRARELKARIKELGFEVDTDGRVRRIDGSRK